MIEVLSGEVYFLISEVFTAILIKNLVTVSAISSSNMSITLALF